MADYFTSGERAIAETDMMQQHSRVAEAARLTRSLEISRDDASPELQAELTAARSAADGFLKVKTEKVGLEVQLTVCSSVPELLSCSAHFTVRRVGQWPVLEFLRSTSPLRNLFVPFSTRRHAGST